VPSGGDRPAVWFSFFAGLRNAGFHPVAQNVAFELRVLQFSAIWPMMQSVRLCKATAPKRRCGQRTSEAAGHAFERRDRAVLLLLARLALRASEVAQLKFSDIDWRNGGIRLSL
jgi:integrase